MTQKEILPVSFRFSLAANGTKHFDFKSPSLQDDNGVTVRPGAPFNNYTIINETQGVLISAKINGDFSGKFIPGGVIFDEQAREVHSLTLQNLSTTTAANIIVTLDNNSTVLQLLKERLR